MVPYILKRVLRALWLLAICLAVLSVVAVCVVASAPLWAWRAAGREE